MAYSDYGGYAYRNGERVIERSDVVYPSKELLSTPGAWPGWFHAEGRGGSSHHVLLGSGPIYVSLYKQSTLRVYRGPDEVPLLDIVTERRDGDTWEWEGEKGFDSDAWLNEDVPGVFEIDGHRLEVYWFEEDNYYQYARLIEPDGTEWTGFSGYGVGAGLEDGDYGYSTIDREQMLRELWPAEQKAVNE